MKHREKSFVRERYDARTKARSIAAIEAAWRDMDAIVTALDRYVAAEEVRTRITDVKDVTYSTAAMAARVRSCNLKKSVIELKAKLLVATAEYNSALAKLAALEVCAIKGGPLNAGEAGPGQHPQSQLAVAPNENKTSRRGVAPPANGGGPTAGDRPPCNFRWSDREEPPHARVPGHDAQPDVGVTVADHLPEGRRKDPQPEPPTGPTSLRTMSRFP